MRLRTAALTAMVAVAAAGTLAPAVAAPQPKPVKHSYEATAPVPDPTPFTGQTGGNCSPTLDDAKHEEPFKMPFAGTLTVDLTGFQGDWALAVLDAKGEKLADHDNDVLAGEAVDAPSQIILKVKKPTELIIRACNFAGGPTAQVDILATPKK
jgi:hypothetical protein